MKNTFRYGFSFLPVSTFSVFGEYNLDFGKNKNYFELGAGPTLYWDQGINYFIFGRIGYRYISDRFIFRVGFTPYLFIDDDDKSSLRPHFGITLGIPLKNTLH